MKSPRTILLENIVRLCAQGMQSADQDMRLEASREHAAQARKLQASMAADAHSPDSHEVSEAMAGTPHAEVRA